MHFRQFSWNFFEVLLIFVKIYLDPSSVSMLISQEDFIFATAFNHFNSCHFQQAFDNFAIWDFWHLSGMKSMQCVWSTLPSATNVSDENSVGLRWRLQYDLFPIIIWQKNDNLTAKSGKSWIIRLAPNPNWQSFLRQNFDILLLPLSYILHFPVLFSNFTPIHHNLPNGQVFTHFLIKSWKPSMISIV